MPSKQSEAVRRRWEAARLAMVRPDGTGPDDESWGDLTAEPREVDYLEVPVDEATAAYRWLLDRGTAAGHIAFAGDSVGAWLAITVQLRARDQGLPLPAAAMLISPLADMEAGGESYETNRDKDPFFGRELVRGLVRNFLGETGDLRDPLASPLYADLTGLSPVYIQAGGDEALLDDARRLDEHARKAGVDARLDIFPGMLHTFQMAAGRAPEADKALRRMAGWVRPRLGVFGSPGDWLMTPTLANGQPAAAAYYRGDDGSHQALGVAILTVTTTGITGITVFSGGPELVAKFDLPPVHPGPRSAAHR